MNGINLPKPVFRGFALICDQDGIPVFDDPENAPDEMKALITDDQLKRMDRDIVAGLGLISRLEKL